MKQNRLSGEVVLPHLTNRLHCSSGLLEIAMQSMTTYETQYRSAAALFLVADFLQAGARYACVAAKQLHAWLERRRVAAAAFHDFATMGERELRDIGLSRADLHRAAWGDWDRLQEPL